MRIFCMGDCLRVLGITSPLPPLLPFRQNLLDGESRLRCFARIRRVEREETPVVFFRGMTIDVGKVNTKG